MLNVLQYTEQSHIAKSVLSQWQGVLVGKHGGVRGNKGVVFISHVCCGVGERFALSLYPL